MTSMRPFQIIVISIFAFLAVIGVLLFASFKGFGGSKPLGVVTIWGTLPSSAVDAALDDLKRNHQEYAKVSYVERDPATFDADLADAIAAGHGPDLIITDQERLLSEEDKLSVIPFSSVPERAYRDNYLPIYELFLTNTGTYGIPFVADPLVLYYNRATLSSAGIAEPPATWESIVGLAPQLTQKGPGGTVAKSAIALGSYDNIPDARGIVSLLLLQSGTKITEQTQAGLRSGLTAGTDQFSRAPGESALAFYTQFADPAKIVYSWNRSFPDARQAFVAGDVALYVGYASELPNLKAANPNLDFDMTYVPQPQTATAQVDYGLAYAFAIPHGSANSVGAYKTAQALASQQEVDIAAPALDMAPALRSEVGKGSGIYAPIVNTSALRAEGWLSPSPSATDTIFAGMITSILSGAQTVHDALSAADQNLNAAL